MECLQQKLKWLFPPLLRRILRPFIPTVMRRWYRAERRPIPIAHLIRPAAKALSKEGLKLKFNAAEERTLSLAAIDLLTPYRFDIPAKVIYARYWEKGKVPSWPLRLYDEHIRVWNGYYEKNPEKRGLEEFLKSFHDTLESIRQKGFDKQLEPIQLGETFSPVGGAHRIAASLLYGNKVICRSTEEKLATHDYSFYYFKEKADHGMLSTAAGDAIALEYTRLKSNTFFALVFPSAQGKNGQMQEILWRYAQPVYEKAVPLSGNGPVNLTRMIYAGEPWLGSADNSFAGARYKTESCFARKGELRLFILESTDSRQALRHAKEEVRALFGVNGDSIHINDTYVETCRIADALLNANSIHWLHYRRLVELQGFERQVSWFIKWLQERRLDPEDFCITGSAVLSAYGLRECKDLDVVYRQGLGHIEFSGVAGSHNEYGDLYQVDLDEAISDPRYYFYYRGLKFISPSLLKQMKLRRGETKDYADVKLMDRYLLDFEFLKATKTAG